MTDKEWRPKKEIWNNQKVNATREYQVCEQNSLQYIGGFNVGFEAGADAIVGALKAGAVAQWESHHLMPGGKGWLVFIEDVD